MASKKGSCKPAATPRVGKSGDSKGTGRGRNR